LVRINSLSDALGVEILGKAEVGHYMISACAMIDLMSSSSIRVEVSRIAWPYRVSSQTTGEDLSNAVFLK